MKSSELKQLIKEEIVSVLNEYEKFDVDKWKEDWEKEKSERQKKKLKDEKPLTPDEVKKMQSFK